MAAGTDDRAYTASVLRGRPFLVLVSVMTVAAFGSYGATINLVPLVTGRGYDTTLAAWALGLVGLGQVLGRIGYAPLARRTSPRIRTAVIPAAAAVCVAALGLLPGPAAALIALAVLAGAARGAHTLLQASAVADRWGTRAFGRVNGVFSAPITAAIALAPAGGTLAADWLGGYPAGFLLLAGLTAVAAVAALASE
jgi:predicted MFS family arabinose efflux permease